MLVRRRNGFGGYSFYPSECEINLVCTFKSDGHRYVIIQYPDLPFCYRLFNRMGVFLLEQPLRQLLDPYIHAIDQGFYDDRQLAEHIHKWMEYK
ncbi:hypothetical protein LCM20_06050 [Halobacillus litoralis]|uniref:hypothetical protein n=1 Tax=Halobacillus litoralis TaxID=45668 RepID=UPI001CD33847|nr:hypothetical protein [Halobacillus litoralis]MCA0970141.1 hypothetical protein [Halobacillus litoralis]